MMNHIIIVSLHMLLPDQLVLALGQPNLYSKDKSLKIVHESQLT